MNTATQSPNVEETKPIKAVHTESRPTKPKPVSRLCAPLQHSGQLKHKAKRIQEDVIQPKRDLLQALERMSPDTTKPFELTAVGSTI